MPSIGHLFSTLGLDNDEFISKWKQSEAQVKKSNAKMRQASKRLAKSFDSAKNSIGALTIRMRELQKARDRSFNPKAIERFNKKLAQTKARLTELKNKGLEPVQKSTGLLSGAIGKLGVLAAGAFSIQKLVDFGAQIIAIRGMAEGVRDAFEKIGSPTLLRGLREATKGTVGDLKLMQEAVKAKNLGLPVSKLGDLFEFARRRAKGTGESVDFLVESIVKGIGRKSPLILDNLGITMSALREKTGGVALEMMSVADVTRVVGQIAQEELTAMGEDIDTDGEKIQGLTASWENFKLSVADNKVFNTTLGGILDLTNEWIKTQKLLSTSQTEGTDGVIDALLEETGVLEIIDRKSKNFTNKFIGFEKIKRRAVLDRVREQLRAELNALNEATTAQKIDIKTRITSLKSFVEQAAVIVSEEKESELAAIRAIEQAKDTAAKAAAKAAKAAAKKASKALVKQADDARKAFLKTADAIGEVMEQLTTDFKFSDVLQEEIEKGLKEFTKDIEVNIIPNLQKLKESSKTPLSDAMVAAWKASGIKAKGVLKELAIKGFVFPLMKVLGAKLSKVLFGAAKAFSDVVGAALKGIFEQGANVIAGINEKAAAAFEKQVQDLTKRSKITEEEAREKLGGPKTIGENLGRGQELGGGIAAFASKDIASGIQSMITVFGEGSEAFKEIVLKINETIGKVLEKLAPIFDKVFQALTPILDVFIALLEPLTDLLVGILEPLLPILKTFGDLLGLLLTPLKPIVDILSKLLLPVFKVIGIVLAAIGKIFVAVANIFIGIANAFRKKENRVEKLKSPSIPSLDTGGIIKKDTIAQVHAGEQVVPKNAVGKLPQGANNLSAQAVIRNQDALFLFTAGIRNNERLL